MRTRPLIAAATAYAATVLAAIAYLALNSWFGANDISGLLVWTLPLAALVYGASRFLDNKPVGWRYVAAIFLGPMLGLTVYLLVALLVGGWIMAFSFPVLFCWVFGGLLGLTLTAWMPQRRTWPVALLLAATAILALAKANAYAHAPEPRIALYLKSGATPADIQYVWEHVIGRPSSTGQGFDLLDGISGAGVSGYAGEQPILTVSMWKRTSTRTRDSLIALIRQSPLIERVVLVPASDTSGVRTSVSY